MTTANKTGSTENIGGSGQGYRFERFQRGAMLSGTIGAMIRMFRYLPPVLDRASSGAWRDMWRAMPPVAMSCSALKTMGVGRRKH